MTRGNTLLWILCWPGLVMAQDIPDSIHPVFRLTGYFKEMPSLSFEDKMNTIAPLQIAHLRIQASLTLKKGYIFKTAGRARFFSGSGMETPDLWAKQLSHDNGLADFAAARALGKKSLGHLHLDRLYLNKTAGKWEFTFGRQRINWGIHTLLNPNDIFNAGNFLDIDYEEKPGSDALRVQYAPKPMTTVEAAWKTGEQGREHTAALLLRTNTSGWDIQGLAGLMYKDIVMGFGWAGNTGNASFKGECAWFHPIDSAITSQDQFSWVSGLDFTLAHGWFVSASYLFQTSGSNHAGLNPASPQPLIYAKKLLPYRHTILVSANKGLNSPWSAGTNILYAPGGNHDLLIFPNFQLMTGNSTDLSFFAQILFGKRERFKSQSNQFFCRFRYSF